MLTHKILMKHFGQTLKSNYKYYKKKVAAAYTDNVQPPEPKGISIRRLINLPTLRAAYSEGEDGESFIDILFNDQVCVELTSYGHTVVYFRRFGRSDKTERSTTLYNCFMPYDYLIQFERGHYTIGTELLSCRFEETTTISFNSSNQIKYGLNVMKVSDSKIVKDRYDTFIKSESYQFGAALKLYGKTKVKMSKKRANGLLPEIKPKYMDILKTVVTGRGRVTDIINLLTITGVEFTELNGGEAFKKAMRKEEAYARALMEKR